MPKTRIVIIGAGYAGLMTAIRLAGKVRRQPLEITLVNGAAHFVERLRLHQLATNQKLKQRPIIQLLRGTGVHFVQGWVRALDVEQRTVQVESANGVQSLPYDKLVYALGSQVDRTQIAGVEHSMLTLSMPVGRVLPSPCVKSCSRWLKARGLSFVVVGQLGLRQRLKSLTYSHSLK